MTSTISRLTAAGFAIGLLASAVEVARLAWFSPGISVPTQLGLYAAAIDGVFLGLVAFVAGLLWQVLCRTRRRPTVPSLGGPRSTQSLLSRRVLLQMTAGAAASVVVVSAGIGLQRRVLHAAPGLGGGPSSPGSGGTPPNVVLVTIDTLRADQLGIYGHPFVKTPALDAIGRAGAVFSWHFIQEPQTNPSHASMFTGLYPASSGIRVHMVDKLPASIATTASVLQAAGYQTAGLYSWLSLEPQYSGLEHGFQTYQSVGPASSGLMASPTVEKAMAQYRIAEQYLLLPNLANDVLPWKSNVESTAKGRADLTTDAAIAQLQAFAGDAPYFLWVHYFDPHYPYDPPAAFAQLYDPSYRGPVDGSMRVVDGIQSGSFKPADADIRQLLSLYQGEITFLDTHISRLFQEIDRLGQTSNTVVAVTGDHGESFGEHADLDEGGDFFHPHSLYNTEQRVPLLLRYPARLKAGTTVKAATQAIDLFPTLLELAQVPASGQAQGKSLVQLLDGRDDGIGRAAFSAMPDYVFTSLTVDGWKLIQNNASGLRRLFDLSTDPVEQNDQMQARPDVANSMTIKLQAWMKDVKIA